MKSSNCTWKFWGFSATPGTNRFYLPSFWGPSHVETHYNQLLALRQQKADWRWRGGEDCRLQSNKRRGSERFTSADCLRHQAHLILHKNHKGYSSTSAILFICSALTSRVGGAVKTQKKKFKREGGAFLKLSHPPPRLLPPPSFSGLPTSFVEKVKASSRHCSVCLLQWPAAEPCPRTSPSPRTAESTGRSASSRK